MIAPRRGREERIVLKGLRSGIERRLVAQTTSGDPDRPLPLQRRLAISPDGRTLAYLDPRDGALHVQTPTGREWTVRNVHGGDVRFSPDGRHLAAVTSPAALSLIVLVDLATGAQRSLGQLASAAWLEWVRDGVVVLAGAPGSAATTLHYFSLAGPEPVALAYEAHVDRFVTAARGSRVVYFARGQAFTADLAQPNGMPRSLGPTDGRVINAEATPDGSRIAFATAQRMYVIDGDGPARLVESRPGIHSVWFSSDGTRLAYASPTGAVVMGPAGTSRIGARPGRAIRTMRFRQGGHELVVTLENEAILWDPVRRTTGSLARATRGERYEVSDLLGTELVLWTTRESFARNANFDAPLE